MEDMNDKTPTTTATATTQLNSHVTNIVTAANQHYHHNHNPPRNINPVVTNNAIILQQQHHHEPAIQSPLHRALSSFESGVNTPLSDAAWSTTSATPPTRLETLLDVLDNNRKWADQIVTTHPGLFEKLEKKQEPDILWIGCSDARVPAENICGLGPGDLFVHRNIANVVVHTDLSMLSVLQYAVDILKVKHIVVCGHYKCGGCMSAMSNKQFGLIDNWLRNIKDIYSANSSQLDSLPEAEKGDVLVELNVAKSVLNLCHTTIVQNAWDRKQQLSIHGWVYRLSDGILEDLELCINHKEEVNSIYTYVTNTGIHTAKRRGTVSSGIGGARSPISLASMSKVPSAINSWAGALTTQSPSRSSATPSALNKKELASMAESLSQELANIQMEQ
ncbi:hypothetical protein HK100_011625 [Physocladia obscura]|uniref:Carbonic anhydrase n=1 Tax=Physocladia obscura TaxID=109957 RepID=A0AAD5XD39_9FUNG|nr:hypothetical protein HK100_011625 [Physocladia obscura]